MSDCRHCGEPVPRGARTCGHCGAPVRGRPSVLLITAILALLCLAALGVAFLLLAGRSSDQQGAAVDQRGDDFVWLDTAMKQCDEQASKDPKGLHYLVIPLVDEPRDEP